MDTWHTNSGYRDWTFFVFGTDVYIGVLCIRNLVPHLTTMERQVHKRSECNICALNEKVLKNVYMLCLYFLFILFVCGAVDFWVERFFVYFVLSFCSMVELMFDSLCHVLLKIGYHWLNLQYLGKFSSLDRKLISLQWISLALSSNCYPKAYIIKEARYWKPVCIWYYVKNL